MIKRFLLLICLWLGFSFFCKAQNTSVDFQAGFGSVSQVKFEYKSKVDKIEGTDALQTSNLSLGVSSQVYKFINLRTEIGLVSAEEYLEASYPSEQNLGDITWKGSFETTRLYVGVMPEIRGLNGLIYFNAGFLISKDIANGFTRGDQKFYGSYFDLTEKYMKSSSLSKGTSVGFGVNPMFHNTGFLLGVRFLSLSPVGVNDSNPKIGFNTTYLTLGISHKIN